MEIQLETMLPEEIEARSFEMITRELSQKTEFSQESMNPVELAVLKRVIHTTADFDYAENLTFTGDAARRGMEALKKGACIVTDTQMARSGINKKALARFGGEVYCYISDEDVAAAAKENKTTRSKASMDKAAALSRPVIFAIGNAPTALIRLYELICEGRILPELIIGVPVGFVNVVESKELFLKSEIPGIIAKGRKGGSNVAAAICNGMLYELGGR